MGAGIGEVVLGWAAASSSGRVSISCSIAWITPSLRKKLHRQNRIYHTQQFWSRIGSMQSMLRWSERLLLKLQLICHARLQKHSKIQQSRA